jgi:hypothetical protein
MALYVFIQFQHKNVRYLIECGYTVEQKEGLRYGDCVAKSDRKYNDFISFKLHYIFMPQLTFSLGTDNICWAYHYRFAKSGAIGENMRKQAKFDVEFHFY